MTKYGFLRTGLTVLAITLAASVIAPGGASAQGLFGLFGGGGGGGRSEVSFPYKYSKGTIIVSFSDRRLYKVLGNGRALSYPIGVPKPDARWQGTLNVSRKAVNPGWTPTANMRRDNPSLPAHVPGGHPRNPLGVRALYLGSTLYRIHGTDAPWTIGREVSYGCIRLYNNDVIDLYNRTGVGTRVVATNRSYRRAAF